MGVCDAMDTAEEVPAELAACNAKESSPEEAAEAAARWTTEPFAKEAPSEEPVATFLVA